MTVSGTRGGLDIGRSVPRRPVTLEVGGNRQIEGQVDFFERFGDAFLHEARAFVDAVRTGGPTPSSIADAREATRLACAMREALRVG